MLSFVKRFKTACDVLKKINGLHLNKIKLRLFLVCEHIKVIYTMKMSCWQTFE